MLQKWIKYAILFLILLVVFVFGVPLIKDELAIPIYFLFIFAYAFLGMWFLNGKHPFKYENKLKGIRFWLGWAIVIFVFDLIFPPYLINMEVYVDIPDGAKVSADYIAYNFFVGFGFPQFLIYLLVYPITITVLLLIADYVLGKRFVSVVKNGV